jgi:hypothetical protein
MLRGLALVAAVAGALVTAGAASADNMGLSIQALERIGAANAFAPGPVVGHVGDTVYYQIVVTNNGADWVALSLDDSRCTGLTPGASQSVGPNGGSVVYTCSHLLTSTDGSSWTNIAILTGTTTHWATITLLPVDTVARVAVEGGVAAAHVTIRHHVREKPSPCGREFCRGLT